MRLVTWNVRRGGRRAARPIAEALVALDADVVVLTEITAACSPPLTEALSARGWQHVRATAPPPHEYGVFIASRSPLVQRPFDEGPAPHRALMVDVEGSGVAIFGGYLPLPKQGQRTSDLQHRFWSWLLQVAKRLRNDALLVAGDFNTCLGVDGAGRDLAGAKHLARLHGLGFRDAFRVLHPDAVAHSWWYRTGQGFRIDHVHASPGFSGGIRRAEYVTEVDGRRLAWNRQGPRPHEVISDHAALLVEIA